MRDVLFPCSKHEEWLARALWEGSDCQGLDHYVAVALHVIRREHGTNPVFNDLFNVWMEHHRWGVWEWHK